MREKQRQGFDITTFPFSLAYFGVKCEAFEEDDGDLRLRSALIVMCQWTERHWTMEREKKEG